MIIKIFSCLYFVCLAIQMCNAQINSAKRDSLKQAINAQQSDSVKISYLIDLGVLYLIQEPDSSVFYLEQARQLSEKKDFSNLQAMALYNLGRAYYQVKRNQSQGLNLYRKALSVSSGTSKALMYRTLAYHHLDHGSFDSAHFYHERAFAISKELGDQNEIGNCYELLGILQHSTGNKIEAIKNLQKCVEIFENTRNSHLHTAYGNLAHYYIEIGQPALALDYLGRALVITRDKGNKPAEAYMLSQIAEVYVHLSDTSNAISVLHESSHIREQIQDLKGLADNCNLLSQLYNDKAQFEQAKYWSKKAIQINRDDRLLRIYLNAYCLLGDIYIKTYDSDSAYYYYKLVYDIASEKGIVPYQFTGLLGLAKSDTLLGHWAAAALKAKQALLLVNDHQSFPEKYQIHQLLFKIYEHNGNFKSAYHHLMQFKIASDSLFNSEKSREFGQIEAKYLYEQETQKLLAENRQRELTMETTARISELIGKVAIAGFIIALTLLVLIIIPYKRLKVNSGIIKKQKLELEAATEKEQKLLWDRITSKDKELAMLAMQANEKNQLLKKIDEELENSTSDEAVEKIRKVIQSQLDSDTWDNFLSKFEDIYPHFFSKLKSEYNSLTLNQLKLCAYIKVGMDNAEISKVTNTEMTTVKKNIQRIKKRLNLGTEASIRDFLIRFS